MNSHWLFCVKSMGIMGDTLVEILVKKVTKNDK